MAWYVPGNPTTSKVRIFVRPERNGQIDLPDRECFHSRDDPMERGRRPKFGLRDVHIIECQRIEHIDVACPVYQDLVDPLGLEQESNH
jgi:hypothetical protein